ncbi:MAG TPA: hypothetical protein VES60_11950 [Nakamurella sp.]|nr:hypothetical protein [Nakamurella sp.]
MARWWRPGGSGLVPQPAPPARESAPAPAAPVYAPVQRAEWRDVPPLRPVVTAISPVAPPDAFARTLASWQNPSFLEPLGHAVDPAGPAGQVDGLAMPAAPRTVSRAVDLPVAARGPAAGATVQRAAGSWLGFAESPTAVGAGAAPVEPFPGNGFTADVWDGPRTLSVAPASPGAGTLTVAPDLPVRSTLPAVPRPAMSSPGRAGAPTVSRSVADDAHPDDGGEDQAAFADGEPPAPTDSADHRTPDLDEQHGKVAVSDAVAEAPHAAAGTGLAPLIGEPVVSPTGGSSTTTYDNAVDNTDPTTDIGATLRTAMPLAATGQPTAGSARPSTVQRSGADRPVRATGLGAPVPSVPTVPTGPGVGSPRESPAAQPLQRAGAQSDDVHLPPVQRTVATPVPPSTPSAPSVPFALAAIPPAAQSHLENSAEHSGDSPSSALTAPLVGLAQVMRAIDPAEAGAEAARVAGAEGHTGTPAAPVPATSSSVSSSVSSSLRPGLGSPVPRDVQRSVGGDLPAENAHPTADVAAEPDDGVADSADAGTSPAGTTVAPTLAAESVRSGVAPVQQESSGDHADSGGHLPVATHLAPDLAGAAPYVQRFAETPAITGHVTDESASMAPMARPDPHFEEAHPLAAAASGDLNAPGRPLRLNPLLGERMSPRLALGSPIGPPVQRAVAPGPTRGGSPFGQPQRPGGGNGGRAPAPGHATGFSPAGIAVQRSQSAASGTAGARPGLGAALPTVPASIGQDTVSVRAMSLDQMFAPGAAAIASGAAHSDGAGSVVFHAPTVDEPQERPSVQRFGLPGADVLSSASKLADRAKSAAGGYADAARGAGGGLLDSARNAAGGYADTARNTVGGYADTARNTVGGYADTARTLAGGYADSARSAAGSTVNAAQTAVGDAAGAARGAAGQVVDSVQSAASGAAGAAQNAAAGATGAAGGAVAGAAGAAANALPTDLDELARRLFDPLSARLKSELWLDRERAGMVTDLRR